VTNGSLGVLNVSASYLHSYSDTYYKGINTSDKQFFVTDMKDSYIDFSSLALSYGLTSKLRITADIGYFFDKTQQFDGGYTRYTEGLADATVGIAYDTYRSDDDLFSLIQTFRVTLPVGDFRQEYDDIVLPIDFQPSSGNYKFNIGINFVKRFNDSRFYLMSANSMEMSQMIETNNNTYHKYGNLYNLSLTGAYSFTDYLSGLLQLRCEIRERALNGSKTTDVNYRFINASGGTFLYLSPQVNFNLPLGLGLSLQYNQPVYKNVNGEQLTNHYSFSAGISRSFSFVSAEEESPVEEKPAIDPSLNKTTTVVSGKCEMCKARIEGIVNEIKNVSACEWDKDTKVLSVYYKDSQPDIDQIEKALAAAGHDTEKYKADDEVYNKLPKCCLYRDK
jgi:copper chaperone CopZ